MQHLHLPGSYKLYKTTHVWSGNEVAHFVWHHFINLSPLHTLHVINYL